MTGYLPTVFNGKIDQLLDEAMLGLNRESAWTPASNVWEDEKGFHVQLDYRAGIPKMSPFKSRSKL